MTDGRPQKSKSRDSSKGGEEQPLKQPKDSVPLAGQALCHAMTAQQLCEYIADMSLQMRQLTRASDLRFLTYLLEMVFEESFSLSRTLKTQVLDKDEKVE